VTVPESPPTQPGTIDGSPRPASPEGGIAPGRWGHFEVGELLGEGGMGVVYRATDCRLGREVALKFIRGAAPSLAQRFQREARAQARVEHEGVCRVFEVGDLGGRPYIAMQLVDGKRLDALRDELRYEEKAQLVRDVALAVQSAHRLGIIHRDLKPSNVLVERTEDSRLRPVLMDFGLARDTTDAQSLSETSAVMGTPQFMSPEQALGAGRRLDRRTDVYSLGAILYDLLVGRPPFVGTTLMEILVQLGDAEPEPPRKLVPSIPTDLETIAIHCLERDPARRYDSARALADDLQRFLDGDPITARPPSRIKQLWRRARKHRALTALAAVAVVAVGLLGTVLVRSYLNDAKIARALMEEAEYLPRSGGFLRNSEALPLHDMTREKALVRGRLRHFEAGLPSLPAHLQGPARTNAARLHLYLGEFEAALEGMQAAWDGGYRAENASYSLGRALAEVYGLKLAEAERVGGPAAREAMKQRLARSHHDPALAHLREGEASAIDPGEYVEGLIAFYDDRFDDAIMAARRTALSAPWLFEAPLLEADALTARGTARRAAGRYSEAKEDYARALDRYLRAADMSRSNVRVQLALSTMWCKEAERALTVGESTEAALGEARAAADRALVIDPGSQGARAMKAWADALAKR
jgi:serine/threonine-protein kinase